MPSFPIEPGAIYVFDRGYLDFSRLRLARMTNVAFCSCTACTGLRCDQTVQCAGKRGLRDYPDTLRRVRFYDAENKRTFIFLTNNFTLPALAIAQIYRSRWRIELFFRWIKQHLRIHRFYGTSPNAVKTQIWTALCVYLLVAIARKRLGIERDLFTILQVLSVSLFEKTLLREALSEIPAQIETGSDANQLSLLDL